MRGAERAARPFAERPLYAVVGSRRHFGLQLLLELDNYDVLV
jgi:hypothetical protein